MATITQKLSGTIVDQSPIATVRWDYCPNPNNDCWPTLFKDALANKFLSTPRMYT